MVFIRVMLVRALTILTLQNIFYLISFDSLDSGFNVFSSDHGGFFPGLWNSSTSYPVPKRRSFLVHGISSLLQALLSGLWRTLFGCSRFKEVFRFDNRGIPGHGYHFLLPQKTFVIQLAFSFVLIWSSIKISFTLEMCSICDWGSMSLWVCGPTVSGFMCMWVWLW